MRFGSTVVGALIGSVYRQSCSLALCGDGEAVVAESERRMAQFGAPRSTKKNHEINVSSLLPTSFLCPGQNNCAVLMARAPAGWLARLIMRRDNIDTSYWGFFGIWPIIFSTGVVAGAGVHSVSKVSSEVQQARADAVQVSLQADLGVGQLRNTGKPADHFSYKSSFCAVSGRCGPTVLLTGKLATSASP